MLSSELGMYKNIRVFWKRTHDLDHQSNILFLDILKQVRHPNVVSMHGLYESKEAVYIVTDLAGGGELFTQLLAKGNYTEKDASAMVKQVLEGVEYLHSLDVRRIFQIGFMISFFSCD